MNVHASALIADDDEPLRRQLANVWPKVEVVAQARNGREAVELFERAAARRPFPRRPHAGPLGRRGGRTASVGARTWCSSPRHDYYAVQAFAQGALDYLREAGRARSPRRNGEPPQRTGSRPAAGARHRVSCCRNSARSSRGQRRREGDRCAGFRAQAGRPCGSSRPTTSITSARTRSTRGSPGATDGKRPPRRWSARRSKT